MKIGERLGFGNKNSKTNSKTANKSMIDTSAEGLLNSSNVSSLRKAGVPIKLTNPIVLDGRKVSSASISEIGDESDSLEESSGMSEIAQSFRKESRLSEKKIMKKV